MAWETLHTSDGIYLVDWEGLARIIRSAVRSQAMFSFAEEKTEKHVIGPNIHTIEINWPSVNHKTTVDSDRILRDFFYGARTSMHLRLSQLHQLVAQGHVCRSALQAKMTAAQRQTMANIETSVRRGEFGKDVAREVRDASVEFVMIGATVLSGGAAAAAVGAGSVLKGTYAYQDTSRLPAAVMTASTNLLMAAIPLKVNPAMEARFGQLGWGILWGKIEGIAEIPKSMLEGEHLAAASAKSAVTSGMAVPSQLVKDALEHSPGYRKWAFPAEVMFKAIEIAGQRLLVSAVANNSERKTAPTVPPARSSAEKLSTAVVFRRDEIDQFAVRKIGSSTVP